MRPFLLFVACVVGIGLAGTNAFETRTAASAQLSEREVQRYERIQKMPGVKRAKLVAVDEQMLSRSAIPVDFDGKRVEFNVTKSEGQSLWKGRSGKNLDRFVIRNIDGRYSGHLLINGKSYVLTPVKRGVSVLYEMSTNFECGMGALEEESK